MPKATLRLADAPTLVNPAHSVTMQDIAERCGVHRSTVQRALAGSERVKTKTAEQISLSRVKWDTMRSCITTHAGLPGGKTAKPSSIIRWPFFFRRFLRHPYYLYMFQGILDILVPSHYDLLTTYWNDEVEGKLPFSILCGNVDGAFVIGDEKALTKLRDLLRATTNFAMRPFVSLVSPFPGIPPSSPTNGVAATRPSPTCSTRGIAISCIFGKMGQ